MQNANFGRLLFEYTVFDRPLSYTSYYKSCCTRSLTVGLVRSELAGGTAADAMRSLATAFLPTLSAAYFQCKVHRNELIDRNNAQPATGNLRSDKLYSHERCLPVQAQHALDVPPRNYKLAFSW